jgi:citrate lyase gamma subunit
VVAQRVVDVLEAVQVDEQQRQLLAVARGALQGVLQAVVEQQAVRQRVSGSWCARWSSFSCDSLALVMSLNTPT